VATSPGLPRLHYRLDRSVTSQQERGNWRKPPGRAIQAIALSCCQPSRQAAVPYVRVALRAVLTPQIETTKATGLVFLPWAMTGLILADTAPLQAVLVQAVVMFLVLAATATTTVVIALGLIRRLFTPDHRLVHLPTPADH